MQTTLITVRPREAASSMNTREFVSIGEAARLLGVSPQTARQILADNADRVQVIRPRVQRRYRLADLLELRQVFAEAACANARSHPVPNMLDD